MEKLLKCAFIVSLSDQLDSIRSMSFARVLCDTSDSVAWTTYSVFWIPSEVNPWLPCHGKDIPHLNLEAWRDESFQESWGQVTEVYNGLIPFVGFMLSHVQKGATTTINDFIFLFVFFSAIILLKLLHTFFPFKSHSEAVLLNLIQEGGVIETKYDMWFWKWTISINQSSMGKKSLAPTVKHNMLMPNWWVHNFIVY